MPTDNLVSYITELEPLRLDIAQALSESYEQLLTQRGEKLIPKDSQWTDLDRKVMLEGFTAHEEHDYLFLIKLDEMIVGRIELAKTIIKSQS